MMKTPQTSKKFRPLVEVMIKHPSMAGFAEFILGIDFLFSDTISTACAGHGYIFFNEEFFDSLPEETKISITAHEIWHLILNHLERGKGYNPYIYNIAADHVINLSLKKDSFTFNGLKFKICCDPNFEFMSTEKIYSILIKDYQKNPNKFDFSNHVGAGVIEDLIEEVLDENNALEDVIEDFEKQVKKVQKIIGNKTANNLIKLEATKNKVVIYDATYEEIFEDYLIEPLSSGKRTFGRPNRRQVSNRNSGFKLPGRMKRTTSKNRLSHLVYALDVSGSITTRQAQQFHDSVRTIKELLCPNKLTVLFFDTQIKLERTFTDLEAYKNIHVRAGGGTSLNGVYARTKILKPEALVVFTDMQVTVPPNKPEWETIWLVPSDIHSNLIANYGKTYLIPSKDKK